MVGRPLFDGGEASAAAVASSSMTDNRCGVCGSVISPPANASPVDALQTSHTVIKFAGDRRTKETEARQS